MPATRCQSSGPLGALLSSLALDVRLMTALQVLQVLSKSRRLTTKEFNEELPAYKFWRRRCLVLCDCKPALQQIENAHRKGMPEGLRDWERGGLLEAIAHYRSQLEAVVFVWVPSHVGIACNAYADAVATAYLGKDVTEDASKVVRDAVRTRPCMYTVRREAAEDPEKREIVDRRTYGHMRQSAHEWVCEQLRKTV